MFYKTEDLLDSIKARSLVPVSQTTFTDTDLIRFANEELQGSLVSDVLSVREDFFLRSKIIPLVPSLNHYAVPERAIGNALKELFLVDSNGNKSPLARVNIQDLGSIQDLGKPAKFAIRGDELMLLPTPSSATDSLEPWYFSRPNRLVSTSAVAKILSVSSVGSLTTFTVDTDLTGSLSVGDEVDFVRATSPFMNWAEDVAITAITGSSIEVLSVDVENEVSTVLPQVGDYVAPAETANIIQLPQEMHPILAQMVAARTMEALGDLQKLQAVNAKLGEMRKQAFTMISNRVESETPSVINKRGIFRSLR